MLVLRTPTGLAVNGYMYNADGSKGALQQVTLDKFGTMAAKATTSVDLRCNLGLTSQNSTRRHRPLLQPDWSVQRQQLPAHIQYRLWLQHGRDPLRRGRLHPDGHHLL